MKRLYRLILAAVVIIAVVISVKWMRAERFTEKNNELPIENMETCEISREILLDKIYSIEDRMAEIEYDGDIILKMGKIENGELGRIMMKSMTFRFDDLLVDIEAYFDVDEESGMVRDTLFAWSMPRETDKGYGQAYIFDFTKNEYPAGEANIRVRGIYNGRGEYMNLYYRDGENTGEF